MTSFVILRFIRVSRAPPPKGKVADIDFVNLTIDIAVDGGKETVTVPALEVRNPKIIKGGMN